MSVEHLLALLPRILTEKIQDVTKALRKKAEAVKKALEEETRSEVAEMECEVVDGQELGEPEG